MRFTKRNLMSKYGFLCNDDDLQVFSRHRSWSLAAHHAIYVFCNATTRMHSPANLLLFSLCAVKDKPEAGPSAYDSPNSSPSIYFEPYPLHKAASVSQSLGLRSCLPSLRRRRRPQCLSTDDDDFDFAPSAACAKGYTRPRSRIGTSKWEFPPTAAAVPHLRFFNSSFTEHTETPH